MKGAVIVHIKQFFTNVKITLANIKNMIYYIHVLEF